MDEKCTPVSRRFVLKGGSALLLGTMLNNAGPRSTLWARAQVGSVLENDLYRITVANRGAITSLIDKTRGNREFAREIGGRVINDLGSGSGSLQAENAGPVSVTLLAAARDPLDHTTRITLIRDSKRIDIRNDINEKFNDTHTCQIVGPPDHRTAL